MKVLSVFFNSDRVYLAETTTLDKGLQLTNVASTSVPVDLESPRSKESKQGISELHEYFEIFKEDLKKLTVTLPADTILVSQFPGKDDMSAIKLKSLIKFDIQQLYPLLSFDEFTSIAVPLLPPDGKPPMMKAIIIPNRIYETIANILKPLKAQIHKIEVSQFNAHASFLYNYPERAKQTVVLFGIEQQFVDVSVVKAGKPMYYELVPHDGELDKLVETEIKKIKKKISPFVDAAFFFGSGLTRDNYNQAREKIMMKGLDCGRLNAFRMMDSRISERTMDYCSRTMHIFPPCIGGCLPSYHERIKVY